MAISVGIRMCFRSHLSVVTTDPLMHPVGSIYTPDTQADEKYCNDGNPNHKKCEYWIRYEIPRVF